MFRHAVPQQISAYSTGVQWVLREAAAHQGAAALRGRMNRQALRKNAFHTDAGEASGEVARPPQTPVQEPLAMPQEPETPARASQPEPRRIPCAQCAVSFEYVPGTDRLSCSHCDHENRVRVVTRIRWTPAAGVVSRFSTMCWCWPAARYRAR